MNPRKRPTRLIAIRTRSQMRRRATSMIELLTVIALIGVLFGLLIPSMKRSVQAAHSTICMHNLREIGNSLALYRLENGGWLPTAAADSSTSTSTDQSRVWFMKLYPTYTNDPVVFSCPDDPHRNRMLKASGNFSDPAVAEYSSYGINSFIMTAGGGYLASDRYRPTRPLDTILLADLGPDNSSGTQEGVAGPSRNRSFLALDDGFDPFAVQAPVSQTWLTARHGDGINVLTMGSAVRGARTIDMLDDPIYRYYGDCASGGCTLCRELSLYHYSFARDHLFWWTGPVPTE